MDPKAARNLSLFAAFIFVYWMLIAIESDSSFGTIVGVILFFASLLMVEVQNEKLKQKSSSSKESPGNASSSKVSEMSFEETKHYTFKGVDLSLVNNIENVGQNVVLLHNRIDRIFKRANFEDPEIEKLLMKLLGIFENQKAKIEILKEDLGFEEQSKIEQKEDLKVEKQNEANLKTVKSDNCSFEGIRLKAVEYLDDFQAEIKSIHDPLDKIIKEGNIKDNIEFVRSELKKLKDAYDQPSYDFMIPKKRLKGEI